MLVVSFEGCVNLSCGSLLPANGLGMSSTRPPPEVPNHPTAACCIAYIYLTSPQPDADLDSFLFSRLTQLSSSLSFTLHPGQYTSTTDCCERLTTNAVEF